MFEKHDKPEQPGLEAVPRHSGLEVIPLYQQLRSATHGRSSSLHKPELVIADFSEKELYRSSHHQQWDDATTLRSRVSFYPPEDRVPVATLSCDADKELDAGEDGRPRRQGRIRGMDGTWVRIVFCVVLVAILIVVVGAIVGSDITKGRHHDIISSSDTAVTSSGSPTSTGDGSPGSSSSGTTNSTGTGQGTTNATGTTGSDDGSNQSFTTYNGSAVATIAAANGAVYLYYQAPNGTITECLAANDDWTDTATNDATTVVATNAVGGSPVGAVGYTLNGTAFRQVFYLNSDSNIMTTNTTGSSWSEPYSILGEGMSIAADISQIAACSGIESNAYNGVRVYYGSSSRFIEEIGLDFSTQPYAWTSSSLDYFDGSDPSAGVACLVSSTFNQSHIYFRNATTGSLVEWQYTGSGWQIGAQDSTTNNMASTSKLAVTQDSTGHEYIFYQNSNGSTMVTTYYPGMHVQDFDSKIVQVADKIDVGSGLASAYNASSGPTLLGIHHDPDGGEYLQFVQLASELWVEDYAYLSRGS